MSTFNVAVTREDGYWVGVVEGLRGGATESRTLAGLEVELVDLIQGLLDLDEDQVDLNIHMGDEVDAAVKQMLEAAEQLQKARDAYEARQIHALQLFAEKSISTRDSAKLVGLSHQRVSQLVSGKGPRVAKPHQVAAAKRKG